MTLIARRGHAAFPGALRYLSTFVVTSAHRSGRVSGPTRGLGSVRTASVPTRSMSTSTDPSASTARVRRPSPYRLPTLPAFLAAFAPLHAAGWRLDVLQTSGPGATTHSAAEDMISGADLQGRRLVRAYAFPSDRDGWRALMTLMARIGEAVEELDHHPVLLAAPASDLPPDVAELAPNAGYVLYIATHTHTPMPPMGVQMEGKPSPGVTGKDLALAEWVERAFGDSEV
ncbi:hypothetical protein CspHIS471_0407300 [Cutaneotrichosporon sp. HIS471]|nr:hypothetical protein CspHIS471_0407300 [Cutaneotrichosporon sp. HIS471]